MKIQLQMKPNKIIKYKGNDYNVRILKSYDKVTIIKYNDEIVIMKTDDIYPIRSISSHSVKSL